MSRWPALLLLAALVLGGCGSSAHGNAAKRMTVPGYNNFPAITMTVTEGTPEECRSAAQAFVHDAVAFLKPYPSDNDVYRVQARLQFLDFKAHSCDVAQLRETLSSRVTPAQQRYIVEHLAFLDGQTARELERGA